MSKALILAVAALAFSTVYGYGYGYGAAPLYDYAAPAYRYATTAPLYNYAAAAYTAPATAGISFPIFGSCHDGVQSGNPCP